MNYEEEIIKLEAKIEKLKQEQKEVQKDFQEIKTVVIVTVKSKKDLDAIRGAIVKGIYTELDNRGIAHPVNIVIDCQSPRQQYTTVDCKNYTGKIL